MYAFSITYVTFLVFTYDLIIDKTIILIVLVMRYWWTARSLNYIMNLSYSGQEKLLHWKYNLSIPKDLITQKMLPFTPFEYLFKISKRFDGVQFTLLIAFIVGIIIFLYWYISWSGTTERLFGSISSLPRSVRVSPFGLLFLRKNGCSFNKL